MLVFWEERLAFLATPKTGSTAIAAALESLAAGVGATPTGSEAYHRAPISPLCRTLSASRVQGRLDGCRPDARAARLAQFWYRFRQREDTDPARSTRGMSFDEFVQAWCQDPRPAFADVGSQGRFLRPRQGEGVDRLFRYEDIGDLRPFSGRSAWDARSFCRG